MDRENLSIRDLMALQTALWTPHKDSWEPMEPYYGRHSMLYLIEELGECISIVKKKGDTAVTDDPAVRAHFLEEAADVLMYYTDMLLRYRVTPEELSQAFLAKHRTNLDRDYSAQNAAKYT